MLTTREADCCLRGRNAETEGLLEVEMHRVAITPVVSHRQDLATVEEKVAAAEAENHATPHSRAQTIGPFKIFLTWSNMRYTPCSVVSTIAVV